jgi:hypothetical protein
MKTVAAVVLSVAGFLLSHTATPLWAQAGASAQISGRVSDPTGGLVPNATVTATHIDTGLVRTTRSGADGIYALPNLPVGSYKLEVQASGFEAYVQTGIQLEVGNNAAINVTLQVGQVKQEVQASANASMVQTQTTSVSSVTDNAGAGWRHAHGQLLDHQSPVPFSGRHSGIRC